FSSRRRHTRWPRDWSSDVCSSDLNEERERLAHAIRDAEARTAGEIVVVVAGEASGYRTIPILWALLAALATPWPLIWITTLGPRSEERRVGKEERRRVGDEVEEMK